MRHNALDVTRLASVIEKQDYSINSDHPSSYKESRERVNLSKMQRSPREHLGFDLTKPFAT